VNWFKEVLSQLPLCVPIVANCPCNDAVTLPNVLSLLSCEEVNEFNAVIELLSDWVVNPIVLNSASTDELNELKVTTDDDNIPLPSNICELPLTIPAGILEISG